MPWFPDFVSAAELARRQTRQAGHADPVGQYLAALDRGDPDLLEQTWPGEVVVHDPRAGVIRGHRALAHFVHRNQRWLADRHARVETVASTGVAGRAVVELSVTLDDGADRDLVWPVAVVADSPDERSVQFRTYCSQLAVDGRRHLRPRVLGPGPVPATDVVARYLDALRAGDVEAIVATFAPDGSLRESGAPARTHVGGGQLRSFFTGQLGSGGGIDVETCAVTDDGARCGLECTYLRWGGHDLTPQAGLLVFERGAPGTLTAVRSYDDVAAPVPSAGAPFPSANRAAPGGAGDNAW